MGKAKNLKRRVYSYFAKEHQSAKTRILVTKIADIKYIVVNSEEDALLLENNLIKKYKPRYNVLLKDDKSYPSICISNEYFPRVFKTRKIIRKEGTYFGSVQSRSFDDGYIGTDKEAIQSAHLSSGSYAGKHIARQIQGLPGISYQELQRAMHRTPKP